MSLDSMRPSAVIFMDSSSDPNTYISWSVASSSHREGKAKVRHSALVALANLPVASVPEIDSKDQVDNPADRLDSINEATPCE